MPIKIDDLRAERDRLAAQLRATQEALGELMAPDEEEPDEEQARPIGHCPHCGAPVYTEAGFCGRCQL